MTDLMSSVCSCPGLDVPGIQRALAADPARVPALAANALLDPPLAVELALAKGVAAQTAASLLTRRLGRNEVDATLAQIRRLPAKALAGLVEQNDDLLGVDDVPVIAGRSTPALSHVSAKADGAVRRAAARALGGTAYLQLLLSDAVDDAERAEAMGRVGEWFTTSRAGSGTSAFSLLLARHPGLTAAAARSGVRSAAMAAAGARSLTSEDARAVLAGPVDAYILLALVNNPVVSLDVVAEARSAARGLRLAEAEESARARGEKHPWHVAVPFEEVEDPAALQWLAQRTLPSDFRPQGRPGDLPALLSAPAWQSCPDLVSFALRRLAEFRIPGLDEVPGLEEAVLRLAGLADQDGTSIDALTAESVRDLVGRSLPERVPAARPGPPTAAVIEEGWAAVVDQALDSPVNGRRRGTGLRVQLVDADGSPASPEHEVTDAQAWVVARHVCEAGLPPAEAVAQLETIAALADTFPGTLAQLLSASGRLG